MCVRVSLFLKEERQRYQGSTHKRKKGFNDESFIMVHIKKGEHQTINHHHQPLHTNTILKKKKEVREI